MKATNENKNNWRIGVLFLLIPIIVITLIVYCFHDTEVRDYHYSILDWRIVFEKDEGGILTNSHYNGWLTVTYDKDGENVVKNYPLTDKKINPNASEATLCSYLQNIEGVSIINSQEEWYHEKTQPKKNGGRESIKEIYINFEKLIDKVDSI